ncbi:transcription termination factor [uncultured spirochete]|uniref:Transcription termination/antitermination protein NusG n=1 Tax=uncultured spirochete TaxID=156406 RepID=A0A3P3XP77_9SPIR|nr:transcription termination factor [uncultured spirochete]
MAKSWYILHVYSGYENKIEKTIRMLIDSNELSRDIVTDVKVPAEEVSEVKEGKKRTVSRKILPGYILVEMDLPENGWKATCAVIRNITGVTGFVGSAANVRPQPITMEEVKRILQRTGELKGERPVHFRQTFAVGEQVKITQGPFESFSGVIDEVNAEKNRLKVSVQIFGRSTPVEVDMAQVEKI